MKTLALFLIASVAPAVTVQLDNSTTLLDGSLFTLGTQYVAAFQLNSGEESSGTLASLTAFQLGGGTGLSATAQDLAFGFYMIGSADIVPPTSIWVPGGSLTLIVVPVEQPPFSTQAFYTQSFLAGTLFSFDVELFKDLTPGITADQFTFQLYNAEFTELRYEVALDNVAAKQAEIPEPATGAGVAAAVAALAIWRRRTIGGCRT